MPKVNPVPEDMHSVTPHLVCAGASEAIEFYKKAFGATELFRIGQPGMIGHAEMKIGNAIFMLADEFPDMGHLGPKARGGTTVSLMIYVEDVDSAFKQAVDAGGKEERPVENQFWGDRMGTLSDPFGHKWTLATTVEEVPDSELQARMKEWSEKQKQAEPA